MPDTERLRAERGEGPDASELTERRRSLEPAGSHLQPQSGRAALSRRLLATPVGCTAAAAHPTAPRALSAAELESREKPSAS